MMEYLIDHGQFADVPETFFFAHLEKCYPHLFGEHPRCWGHAERFESRLNRRMLPAHSSIERRSC
jgi:hypothetical protein